MRRSLHWIAPFVCATCVALLTVGCQNQSADHDETTTDADHGHEHSDDADAADSTSGTSDESSTDESSTDESSARRTPDTTEPSVGETSATETESGASDSEATADETNADTATSAAEATTAPANTDTASSDANESAPANAEPTQNGERQVTGDWVLWGGTPHRNMVNATTGINLDFDIKSNKNVLWTAKLGSQSYGNPVVAKGKILVGTNNGAEYRPQHKGDRGVLVCFDEKTGEFLWQLTREKLPAGRVNDWPLQGICSSPCVEGDHLWVVTNRCELMCLDLEGHYDGENDGPYTEETDAEQQDADIIWSLDMMEQLGVFPHNLATSSPVVHGDNVYIVTSNGVDEAHLEIPSPRAPSFICVNKTTGEVVWEDSSPGTNILHGQWSSPAIAEVNGQVQVFFPGGDGWLYAFDAASGEPIWKFDLNPKDAKYELGGKGTRNEIIATPVFVENSVIVGAGQDPEHGEGVGHLYRIDATKTGDVSAELDENGDGVGEPNPNSGMIWHYGGIDQDGSVTGEAGSDIFRRTMSTVAVHDGLVYAADLSGFLHCIDFKSGQRYWVADLLAAVWGSPMVADNKVFIADEDGDLAIFETGREMKMVGEKPKEFNSSLYGTLTIANGVMYINERAKLYAISTE